MCEKKSDSVSWKSCPEANHRKRELERGKSGVSQLQGARMKE